MARKADAGFDLGWFAQNLDHVERIQPEEVRAYGLTASQLDDVKTRTKAWAASIRGLTRRESTRSGLHERIEREVERRRAERGDDELHRGGPVGRESR